MELKSRWASVHLYILLGSYFVLLTGGCTGPTNDSSVTMKLPATGQAFTSKTVTASSSSSTWGISNPASFAEIDCYAVLVSASDMSNGKCLNASGEKLFSVGQINGLYPAGSEVTVSVPTGNQRTIRLIGMKAASSGACSFPANGDTPYADLSAPFELGQVTLNLVPGEIAVEIVASLVASKEFYSCTGSNLNFGPPDAASPNPPSLTAILSSTPASVSNATALSVGVGGSDITYYKYKLGTAAATNCTDTTGYSTSISAGIVITDSLIGFGDGLLELCVLGGNIDGQFQDVSQATIYTWTKDTTAPTVSISSPAAGSYINASSQSAFTMAGACSENGQSVNFSGDASGTTTCNSGTWSMALDFSSATEGTVTLNVDHLDLAGNAATQAARSFSKDTTAPSSPSLMIDGGLPSTTSTTVSLSLSAIGAVDMYVTNTAGCGGGGAWEAIASPKTWTLAGTNSLQTVYAMYKDAAGNKTACINDSITHNDPALLTISEANPFNYGNVAVGGTLSHSFTVTNSGALNATSLTEIGLMAPFSFNGGTYPGTGGDCGVTLAPASSCTLVIVFAPTATGVIMDTINLTYNNGVSAQAVTRDIQGTGVSPASLFISNGPTYDYGTRAVGSSHAFAFNVSNSGGYPASGITGTGLISPFNFEGGSFPGTTGTCTPTLAAGDSCTIVIEYSPATTVVHADTIELNYNNGVTAQTITRDLQGTGANPAVLVISEADPYDFGSLAVNTTVTHTFIINNTGGYPASGLSEVGLAAPYGFAGGAYPGGGTCGATLASAGSCTLIIEYAPLSTGPHPGTIDIAYNDGSQMQNAIRNIIGTATLPPFNYLALGNLHSCGKDTTGSGFCWGEGTNGQLGNGSPGFQTSAVQISGFIDWVNMDSFTNTVCGVDSTNMGYCWGANSTGQVGDGTIADKLAPVQLPGGAVWSKVVVGNQHACGLLTNGSIQCWGRNNSGQLGDGTVNDRSSPATITTVSTYSDVAAGGYTTCAITTGGTIECWGAGNVGQIGDASTTPSNPAPVTSTLATGSYTQIAVGGSHVCALTTGNVIHCWGGGTLGQMGNGTTVDHSTTLATVSGTGWSKIAAGSSHNCATQTDNSAWCWGSNTSGQLGDGSGLQQNVPVQVGINYADIFTGYAHSCGIQTDSTLWCWGNNSSGQLGDGTTLNSGSPLQVNP